MSVKATGFSVNSTSKKLIKHMALKDLLLKKTPSLLFPFSKYEIFGNVVE